MSDTPRTDARVRMMIDNDISPEGLEHFARDLERELAETATEMQTLRTANAGLVEKVSETQAALDLSARQLLETVNDRNSIGVQLDLLRDELMRIRARIGETGLIGEHPQLSSIALYCERAQHDIAVRYTPIQERDRLEREVLKLVEKVKRLEESLANIREYWNRDQNEKAMADACWYAIQTASDVLGEKGQP